MTWAQRVVAILMALREYAPITNVLALMLLPIAVYVNPLDNISTIASKSDLFWLQTIFLAAFLARKINNYIVYSHIGAQALSNVQSNDIWCAPCK